MAVEAEADVGLVSPEEAHAAVKALGSLFSVTDVFLCFRGCSMVKLKQKPTTTFDEDEDLEGDTHVRGSSVVKLKQKPTTTFNEDEGLEGDTHLLGRQSKIGADVDSYIEDMEFPLIMAEDMEFPLIMAEDMEFPLIMAEDMEFPPIMAEDMEFPPIMAEDMEFPPIMAEDMEFPPIMAEDMEFPPITAEDMEFPPITAEDMEFAEQMSALGLPISFSSNQEKKNVKAKVISKGSRVKQCRANNERQRDYTGSGILDDKIFNCKTKKSAEGNDKPYDDVAILGRAIQNSCISTSLDCSQTQSSCCIDECSEGDVGAYTNNDTDEWSVFWDEFYGRNYFYNSKTNVSTWDPPPGLLEDAVVEEHASEKSRDPREEYFVDSLLDIKGNQESLIYDTDQLESEAACKSNCYLHTVVLNARDLNVSENFDGVNDSFGTEIETILEDQPLDFVAVNEGEIYCKETWTSGEPMGGTLNSDLMLRKKKRNRKFFKRNLCDTVKGCSELLVDEISAVTYKYWCQRYLLFSKFDEGIRMDEEGWFSVTPEIIAEHHAAKCGGGTIIDCFAGVGGNAIQFAMRCDHVIAIDIDEQKVEYARHNAKIYGVDESIDFIHGDFFSLAPKLRGNAVFLSPPWGGPQYSEVDTYNMRTMLKPVNGYALFKIAMEIAPKVVMFLPRNVDVNQLAEIAQQVDPPWILEVEMNYINAKLKATTAYFTRPS